MTCYYPLKAYKDSGRPNPSGKPAILFNQRNVSGNHEKIELPCGQCIGCMIKRSRDWALRCVHEASLYSYNCYLTLTYEEKNLPEFGHLRPNDFTKFMKRLRKKFKGIDKIGEKYPIRYLQCGEYGGKTGRPHHHVLLFNFDFMDKVLWSEERGYKYYRSATLEELWPYGMCIIGDVTFESAAYVARYVMKKYKGKNADLQYLEYIDEKTGEVRVRPKEYITMSRRPGIGKRWFDKYVSDCYPKDYITINGKKYNLPKFYDDLLEKMSNKEYEKLKKKRKKAIIEGDENERTLMRLKVKRRIKEKKCINLKRSYEDE